MKGEFRLTRPQVQLFDFVGMVPGLIGVVAAVVAIARGQVRSILAWVCLVFGCLGCGIAILAFGAEMI